MKRFLFAFFLILTVFTFHKITSFADSPVYYEKAMTDMKLYDFCELDKLSLGNFCGDEFLCWKNVDDVTFFIVDTAQDCAVTKVPYDLSEVWLDAAYYYDYKIYFAYRIDGFEEGICVIDKEGNVLDKFELQNCISDSGIYKLAVTEDSKVYVSGPTSLMEFDLKGNMNWEAPVGMVLDFAPGDNGKLFYQKIVSEEKGNFGIGSFKEGFFEADLNKGIPGDTDKCGSITNELFCACGEDTVLYYGGINIYKYNVRTDEKESVIDYVEGTTCGHLRCLDTYEGRIRFVVYDPFGTQKLSRLYTYTPAGVKQIKLFDKGLINNNPAILETIEDYNKSTQEYEIVLTDRNTSGNRPDIMFMDDVLFKKNKGRLIDLESYMATSKGLKVSDFNAGVLSACREGTSVKMLPLNITLETFAAGESDYSGTGSFSFDDFLLYIEKKGVLYTDYFLSKESVMEAFMTSDVTHFVDFEKGTCSFDTEEFKELVEKVDGAYSDNRYTKKLGWALKDETGRMLTKTKISSRSWFEDKSSDLGDDVILLGLPTADGQKKFHATASGFGITEYCECVDGAIDFLEYLFKNYRPNVRDGIIPAYAKAFEKIGDYTDSDKFITAVNNIAVPDEREARVVKLVTYWTDKYFNGEISLNTCVKSLQKAVTKYISK